MAAPRMSLSLAELSRQYTVFESDQVLTEGQLNSLTDYLNDQARLTRVELLGVGIVAGLQVSLASNLVTIRKGLGVTTDGDLLLMPANTVYDRFKPYDSTAPRYAPLYVDDTMLTVHELVREGDSDANAQPLVAHPRPAADTVVVMLMESYQHDADLCSGTDCDNLGQTAVDNPRLLLVSRKDASALLPEPSTASRAALALPELSAARPSIASNTVFIVELTKAYREACNSIHGALVDQLSTLHAQLPTLINELFGIDPAPGWSDKLKQQNKKYNSGSGLGIQYYYDFLKDVVDTWNELREALLLDDSLLCPDLSAFPKHLLLGDLKDPTRLRTGFYPSPLVGDSRMQREHARFLVQKLHALINSFNLTIPTASKIMVTPSRGEAASLEDRAIPYYYELLSDLPIQRHWNYRLSKRGASASNYGYRAEQFGGTAVARDPLAAQIGRYDFFRVEGHLGQNVGKAKEQLESIVQDRNLPFLVRAVLLHNDRQKIIIKPPIRYGDLHRLHYLLRNEVATHLSDSDTFNNRFTSRINDEFRGQPIVATANAKHDQVTTAIQKVQPAMASKRYAEYRDDTNWKVLYPQVVDAATNFKSELGEIVRTDLPTPFDSVSISNHPAWLDWLDSLIEAKDDREDDKLLFQNFIRTHPGFEHWGGAGRGGTFVLVYDDNGQVVADVALPYSWPETAEDQPVEPDLKKPDFRLPRIDGSVKLRPPIDVLINSKLTDFQAKIEPVWNAKLDMQKDYFKFFKDSVGAFSNIVKPVTPGLQVLPRNFSDDLLNLSIADIQTKTDQIDRMRAILARPDIPPEQRDAGMKRIETMEVDLAKSVVSATQYVSTTKMDIATGADGGKALEIIASSAGKVSSAGAKAQLQEGLKATHTQAVGAHQLAVGNLMRFIR